MGKPFDELRARMSPEARQRSADAAEAMSQVSAVRRELVEQMGGMDDDAFLLGAAFGEIVALRAEIDAIARVMEGRFVPMNGKPLRPLVDRVRTVVQCVDACASAECGSDVDCDAAKAHALAVAEAELARLKAGA